MANQGFGTKVWHVRALALMLAGLAVWNCVTQWQLAADRRILNVYEGLAIQNSRVYGSSNQLLRELMIYRSGRTNRLIQPK